MSFLRKLKRRNVHRMAALYLAAAWLIMQVVDVLKDNVPVPAWAGSAILAVLAIGFPIAITISWFYELTPEGISLDTDNEQSSPGIRFGGRRADFVIIALLTAALAVYVYVRPPLPSAPLLGPPNSVAVLPFLNMSAAPGNEFFSDGIAQDVLNRLAQVKSLKVIASSSSFSFKGKDVDVATVAEKLSARHVLEGSVRRSGQKVRIAVQLIDAKDSSQIWSESYDRETTVENVFAIQTEIANEIVNELIKKNILTPQDVNVFKTSETPSLDAYDAYLAGRELIYKRENLDDAIDHLARSLRLDDNFAGAHAEFAIAVLIRWITGYYTEDDALRMAERHLDQAEALEPQLPRVNAGRALLAQRNQDPELAVKFARAALEGNANDVDAMNWLQLSLVRLGRYDAAEEVLRQMLDNDPLNIPGRINFISLLTESGRCEDAHELADQLLDLRPETGYLRKSLISLFCEGDIAESLVWDLKRSGGTEIAMWAFIMVGEYDEAKRVAGNREYWIDYFSGQTDKAVETTQRNLQLRPNEIYSLDEAAAALYFVGRYEEALKLFERLLELAPENRPIGGIMKLHTMMRFAAARRWAGDEEGAVALVEMVRQDFAAQRANGRRNKSLYMIEAKIAAFDRDHKRAIDALRLSIENGERISQFLDELEFEEIADDPQFIEVRNELNDILTVEHEKVLQLICFNNPVPEKWRPLPATCDGVVEQPIILSAE